VRKVTHVRTAPIPDWVTSDEWLKAADIGQGKLFRCFCRRGTVCGREVTEKVVWHVVKEFAGRLGIYKLAPHDLRRSCTRCCHDSGSAWEQIQFLLGHISVHELASNLFDS
jgi:integrase